MGRSFGILAVVLGLCGLWACSGSDGHPAHIDEDMTDGGTGAGPDPSGSSGKGGSAPMVSASLRDGGFINIPQVNDILYDDAGGVLLVTTSEGGLASVDIDTGKIASQKVSEGPLMGIDVSPSGRMLAIAENTVDAESMEYWVHLVDLSEKTQRPVFFTYDFALHEGTHDVAFANDETLLITSSFTAGGYVDLLQLSLADDSFKSDISVRDDSMLARSLDNSRVALAGKKDGAGPLWVFDGSSLAVTEASAHADLGDVAISPDGSKVALSVKDAVKIMVRDDATTYVERVPTITQTDRQAAAALFSPVSNSIFVVWDEDSASSPAFVERYDLETLESEGMIDLNIPLATSREGDFDLTRMQISEDGKLLFVTVEKGIQVYAVDP